MQMSAAVRYLEFCVVKLNNTERAIHNFLISSYATSPEEGNYSKLLNYLVKQVCRCVYRIMYVCDSLCPSPSLVKWRGLLRHPVCPKAVYGA